MSRKFKWNAGVNKKASSLRIPINSLVNRDFVGGSVLRRTDARELLVQVS